MQRTTPEWPDHISATIDEAGNMVINIAKRREREMTKKVLISWNELEDTLRENGTPEEPIAFMQDWFDDILKKQKGRIAINVDGEPIIWGQNEESID